VENYGSLHRGEKRVASAGLRIIQEIRLVYSTVLGFANGFTDNTKRGSGDFSSLGFDGKFSYRSTMSIS
jgi:hypothetical protein